MSNIDWDAAVKSYQEGPQFKATPQGIEEIPPPTPLPELFGLAGGVGGALLTRSPQGSAAGRTGAMALGRSLLPSLFGSSVGTAVGLGAEAAFQPVSPERAGMALLENAAWDVGGNLAFTVAGKTIKLGKEALDSLGITKAGTFDDAKVAAQEFLSKKGATLTREQLTGGGLDKFLEEISRGGTGSSAFAAQQKGVGAAVMGGVEDVKKTLQTSPAFQQALDQNEPLSRAAGENFQNLINTARGDFKETYRPFYQKLGTDLNASVDLKGLKAQAKSEWERLAKTNFAGAGAEKKKVLEDIMSQNDMIDFGLAHDLRSNFGAAAQDSMEKGGKATALSSAYTRAEADISKQMDEAFAYGKKSLKNTPYTKALVDEYNVTRSKYKEGMQGLYNTTITQAMENSPSKAGAYIFDLAETEKSTDLFKAITQIDKYSTAQGSKGAQIMNDFKYGFLDQAMSSPEKIKSFAGKVTKGSPDFDPEAERAFYKLFKNEAKPLQEVLNAADVGLESKQSGMAAFLRNKAAITGGQAVVGTLGYIALPSDMKSENLPETLIAAGAFLLTPRLIAKSATNKEAINALAGLAKGVENPKFTGAAAAKFIDRLNKAGVIDSEYINEVDSIFGGGKQNQQPMQTPLNEKVNWDQYSNPNPITAQ